MELLTWTADLEAAGHVTKNAWQSKLNSVEWKGGELGTVFKEAVVVCLI
jgi:hypothetical protein